tara:strand:+ start:31 stop:273 length:243 start_codon:yes stop_codon:yes gene_type:complete
MILELIKDPITWGMGLFVLLCAWHNFKAGHKQGLLEGVDVTLAMLSQQNLIELEHGNDGEVIINAKDGNSTKLLDKPKNV